MLSDKELEFIARSVAEAQAGWRTHSSEIAVVLKSARGALAELGTHWERTLELAAKQADKARHELDRWMRELPPRIKRAMALLVGRGWYVSMDLGISELMRFADLVEQDALEDVDKELCDRNRERINEIKDRLCSCFQHRQKPLNVGFEEHAAGNYIASVPIFLIQADGLCYELLGFQLYSRRKGFPRTALDLRKKGFDPLAATFLEPLRILQPLTEHTRKIKDVSTAFNRHAILHGLATEYGTELNSLKAIALLDYIESISWTVRQDTTETTNVECPE